MQETITLSDGTLVQVADFELGFMLDQKALVEADDDGTVHIEGYASNFDFDRQDEAFEPGAFEQGIKAYMENPVLLYHHKADTALGKIEEMKIDTNGLWVKGIVDAPEPGTMTADYVRKIKNGVIKGFSVGGKFYKRMTGAGARIFKCDLREISVTPLPVNPRTLFAVSTKAFNDMEELEVKTEPADNTAELEALVARLDAVDSAFTVAEGVKASQHPDGPKIAALLYHAQQIHTLATNTKQDAESDDVKSAANEMANHVKKHISKLHTLAAKHGPLPAYYGASNF